MKRLLVGVSGSAAVFNLLSYLVVLRRTLSRDRALSANRFPKKSVSKVTKLSPFAVIESVMLDL